MRNATKPLTLLSNDDNLSGLKNCQLLVRTGGGRKHQRLPLLGTQVGTRYTSEKNMKILRISQIAAVCLNPEAANMRHTAAICEILSIFMFFSMVYPIATAFVRNASWYTIHQ